MKNRPAMATFDPGITAPYRNIWAGKNRTFNPRVRNSTAPKRRSIFARKRKRRSAMPQFKMLIAIALALTASATSALAQPAISELGNFEAAYPNRDPLNGGALTPAGRLGLELPDGASPVDNSYAAIGAGPRYRAPRLHSYDPAAGTLPRYKGRRHSPE